MKINILYTTLSLLLIVAYANDQKNKVQTIKINEGWEFQILKAPTQGQQLIGRKFPTQIPSTIHLDLIKNQLIPDPFYRNNFQTLKWISSCTVKYQRKIVVSEKFKYKGIELIFHGIDTYAQVLINGNLILTANNAFKAYMVRIQKYLKINQQNILSVIIEPTQMFQKQAQSKNKVPYIYAQTRKPKHQYNWDSAPQINTLGIWRDVQIRLFQEIRIDYIWVRNRFISQNKAILNFAIKFQLNLPKNTKLSTNAYTTYVFYDTVKVGKGKVTEDQAYIDVSILSPVFWWPNGIGKPYIYDFQVSLMKNLQKIDSKNISYGIRTTDLYQYNNTFIVKINGHEVFCKGANFVPMDIFYPRTVNQYFRTQKTYTMEKLLDDAAQSNFNMLRIWGGGSYVPEEFLQLASRKGIMLFYDLMFSEILYPTTPQFFHNVQQEIKYQIRNARNYPALVLWNGNNQILQNLQNRWNSQGNLNNYNMLFNLLIPKIINIESPNIPYIPSSPMLGIGNQNHERGGDFHYWGVWQKKAKFSTYQSAIGYFNSQYGIQALPVIHSIKQFTKQVDRTFNTKIFNSHQRSKNKFDILQFYLNEYANATQNFQNNVYLSGVIQAYGIQQAIRSHRTSTNPKSFGTLYWHFNDAWPGITFSSIDYYGRWKPLQYRVKKLYSNIAIFTKSDGGVIAINDNLLSRNLVSAKIKVILFDGTIVLNQQKSFVLKQFTTKEVYKIEKEQIKNSVNQFLIYCQIYENQQFQMSSVRYFTDLKSLNLPKAKLIVSYNNSANFLTLKSKKLVKNLYIYHSELYLHFSDNYFDVVPNIQYTILLKGSEKIKDVANSLKFMSYRQATTNQTLQVQILQID